MLEFEISVINFYVSAVYYIPLFIGVIINKVVVAMLRKSLLATIILKAILKNRNYLTINLKKLNFRAFSSFDMMIEKI